MFEQVLRRTWSASWWASAMPLGDAKQSSQAVFTPRISRRLHLLVTFSIPISSLHQENGRLRSAAKAVQAKIGKILSFWIFWPKIPDVKALGLENEFPDAEFLWKREAPETRVDVRKHRKIRKYGKCIGLQTQIRHFRHSLVDPLDSMYQFFI